MRKFKGFNRTAIAIAVSTVFLLSACAGGGGGGGGANNPGGMAPPTPVPVPSDPTPAPTPTPSPAPSVPYATPTRVGSVTPINSSAYEYDSSAMYSENLTSNGQSLITAGRSGTTNGGSYPTYNINVFDWENGSLVNKTSQWFSGNDNVVLGTEPSVKFGDLNGDGKKDMFVSPNTDNGANIGSGWLFLNNGSSFTRVNLGLNVNGHDSAIYDINRDGVDDIFVTGSRVVFGSRTNNFSVHTVSGRDYGGTAGSVAIADFVGNNTSSVILTDQAGFQTGGTRLYSWAMTDGGRPTLDFELTKISTLPSSRFFLPKWADKGFSGSHDYRALAFDFDNSGKTSAVIFSRPVMANGTWPDFSEIQFLKNQGGGSFIDVTDTTLVGYDTKTSANYNPKLVDVNSDGLTDIVLGATGWGSTTGAQVLIHTKEHKYVASYAAVIDAFVGQSLNLEKAINASAQTGANGIVFVKGPDGSMYLATAISYSGSGTQQKAIYLSKLGTTTTTAQATVNSVKQIWPWMSDKFLRNLNVCPACDFHRRVRAWDYAAMLLDEGSTVEVGTELRSVDPLGFPDYPARLKRALTNAGDSDAILTVAGLLEGLPVGIGIMDFAFMGGSMGSVVGEKIARLGQRSLEKKHPLVIVCASGGARMQEGILSLMQMAKTSAVLSQLAERRIPYISVLTNPTTGGVSASYAMLGDAILAEPGAVIGFAGPRVIKQTLGQDLPEGFQTAEFLLEKGMVDQVVHRKELRDTLSRLMRHMTGRPASAGHAQEN